MALKFEEYSAQAAEKELDESKRSSGSNFVSFKEGANKFRILPVAAGSTMKSPFKVVYQHWLTVEGNRVSFTCPRVQHRSDCPVCALADELGRSDYPADRKKSMSYQPQRTVYVNVIDRGSPDAGPVTLRVPKGVHEALTSIRKNPDIGGDFSHPLSGCDLLVERTGTTKENTKYPLIQQIPRSSPLAETNELMQVWIDSQLDLDKYARLLTPAEIEEKVQLDAATPRAVKARISAPSATAAKKITGRTVEDDINETEYEES